MPELPEVETIVRELNETVIGLKITDAWTDWPRTIKTHTLKDFIKEIKSRKIERVHRRAKYIMMDLSGGLPGRKEGKTLVIHQKISGHLLYGEWKLKDGRWKSEEPGPIRDDPFNRHIRFILKLSNGKMLGLADLRRFGKVYLGDTKTIEHVNDIDKLGPEPLDPGFRVTDLAKILSRKKGYVKKVLMDPFVLAGVGNIYGDEILWYAGIHPLKRVEKLSAADIKNIFKYMRFVLTKAIKAKGDSKQDFRRLRGEFGGYQKMHKAYQLTGKPCQKKDKGIIERVVINARSAHFCPVHQTL